MDHQQQQQYGDPYRGLVPSPQPDHHLHALQYHHQQQPALMSPPQPQPGLMSPPQPQQQPGLMSPPQPQQQPGLMSPPQPQQHHHASLASHFHLLHLVTRLADAIATGTKDQNFDALVYCREEYEIRH
nr:unnamed protein product [Digitaria exilis]